MSPAEPDVGSPPAWAEPLFPRTLAPLTDSRGRPTGAWQVEGAAIAARVSGQFTDEADTYHRRYSASDHFEALFRQALAVSRVKVAEAPLILDLGSGSGVNSVLPCFNLFPGARQVATDVSGELLATLAREARAAGLSEQVVCVAMDATSSLVRPGGFDLVTGASILHHLVRPIAALKAAAAALKPGGVAIFMEPFFGYGVMRLAYERILAEAPLRGEELPAEVSAFLSGMVDDIAARTMPDPARPGFADLDDKWLFVPQHIEKAAWDAGFGRVTFVPHNDHPTLYRDVARTQLRLNTGEDQDLPDWAIDILDSFDRAIPMAGKRLMMLEATIVLTKG
jgi:SAM-dependent methyltransferase